MTPERKEARAREAREREDRIEAKQKLEDAKAQGWALLMVLGGLILFGLFVWTIQTGGTPGNVW